MNHPASSPKILIAPLDWGLGHATRCIPVVRQLLKQNCRVVLAGSGKVKYLLQAEFPALKFLELSGYNIQYSATARTLPLKIVAQIPRLISIIQNEQAWIKKVVAEEKIDIVISDNRYGLYHAGIRSVFITHQLGIKAPFGWMEALLQKLNYAYINRFSECWVPDNDGPTNYAGVLSHPEAKPKIPVKYIGLLSRFSDAETVEEKNQLLVLLSGPEPQRTLLEKTLMEELKDYREPVFFIRGLPGESYTITGAENVTVVNHLPAEALEQKLKESCMIISRCGYSTVMDLATIKKKSILVPTPGQTEQEYLAKHLMRKNFALCIEQKKFRLKNALELAANFNYTPFESSESQLDAAVDALLRKVKSTKGTVY